MPFFSKKAYMLIFMTFLTIILLAILFSQINLNDIITTLTSINPFILLLAFCLYIGNYACRALRFHYLLNKEVRFFDLLTIVASHNMMINILPARTGELSYIYFLKKKHGRTTGDGIATLFIARIFDLIAITLVFFLAFALVKIQPKMIINLLWIAVFVFLLLIVILIYILSSGQHALLLYKRILSFLKMQDSKFAGYTIKKGSETVMRLGEIKINKEFLGIVGLSVLLWAFSFGMTILIVRSMGIELPVQQLILAFTVIILSTMLPIQGIAGFGTNEGIWAIIFIAFGVSTEAAIASGFSYHILILIYTIVLGVTGLLIMRYR